jgi:ElaB/YqjD/DUF883 family membrane-anchored ribosome-binding protein
MTDHDHTDHRSADAIERDIRETQDDMSRTVNRLGDQFTARNLVNALFDKAEDNDVDARRIYDGARRNPLALGLISAGAIWLVTDYDAHPRAFTSSSSGSDGLRNRDEDHDHEHRAYLEHMNRIERNRDEDHDLYQRRRDDARGSFLMIERRHEEDDKSYRDRLDEATETMRRRRHEMAESARKRRDEAMTKAREAGSRVSENSRRGAERVAGFYEDNPLIGGAIAAMVGLIAGSSAPATRSERKLMGEHAEHSLDAARHKAKGLGDKARAKKDEAVDRAERKADPDGDGKVRHDARRNDVAMTTG